jgi:hypothetical protein
MKTLRPVLLALYLLSDGMKVHVSASGVVWPGHLCAIERGWFADSFFCHTNNMLLS